jgi:predicted alpha/beta hydrolase family esterase
MTRPILIVPGFGNSDAEHWQSLWQLQDAAMIRAPFADWDRPLCGDWVATIERAVRDMGPSTIIVAHSLGCLALAHWAASGGALAGGAMLVGVPDPAGPNFPSAARDFTPLPQRAFDFASLIVSSDDDPYASERHTRAHAAAWGSRLVSVGKKGHINASSGLGNWPEGQGLLRELLGDVAEREAACGAMSIT